MPADDYTPITDSRARALYVCATAWDMSKVPSSIGSAAARGVNEKEWDAWLAAHDARVRAEAARDTAERQVKAVRSIVDEHRAGRRGTTSQLSFEGEALLLASLSRALDGEAGR